MLFRSGVTTAEYVLTFLHLLSSNCRLTDLLVNNITIDGFTPDSIEYTVTYPVATPESALFTEADITAVPEDADATVSVVMDGTTAQIFVTAPDGTIAVYVVHQRILLSSEGRLRMIWLDGVEVRNYDSDTLTYNIVLAQGAIIPAITAETLDSLATWEQGMETETEFGKTVDIYGEAQDGTLVVYTINFTYANWAASGTVDTDDYLFYYYGGGMYKAVSIGIGVQLAIYDTDGRRVLLQNVPVADPADVEVQVDDNGNQRIVSAQPYAEGVYFDAPAGERFFYVFFDSKTKRLAKGGKFQVCR